MYAYVDLRLEQLGLLLLRLLFLQRRVKLRVCSKLKSRRTTLELRQCFAELLRCQPELSRRLRCHRLQRGVELL